MLLRLSPEKWWPPWRLGVFGYTYGNGDSMGIAVFVGATVMLQYAMAAKFISLS